MNISFDCDGVLANFESNVTPIINELFPDRLPIPKTYNPCDWYWSDVMRKKDWDPVFDKIKETPDFWLRQHSYPESVEETRHFLDSYPELNVYYITARMATGGVSAFIQTQQWMNNRELRGTVITVDNPKEKQALLRDLDIRFSIDDKIETVRDSQLIPNHRAFLLDQSWNREATWLPRVYSIKEYANHIVEKLDA